MEFLLIAATILYTILVTYIAIQNNFKYVFENVMISHFGEPRFKNFRLFNYSTTFYGLILLFYTIDNWILTLGLPEFLMFLVAVCVFFSGIFTTHNNKIMHDVFAHALFVILGFYIILEFLAASTFFDFVMSTKNVLGIIFLVISLGIPLQFYLVKLKWLTLPKMEWVLFYVTMLWFVFYVA